MGSPQTIAYDDLYRLTSAQVSSGKLGDYGPESYAYDPLNRLTNAAYSTGEQFEYSYDAVGNRLSQTNPGGTVNYLYDEANQLISANGVSYTWDANGNLLSDGTYTYEYDYANRLASAIGQGDVYGFAYNGLGNRYRQAVNGETSTYTLDLAGSLSQVLSDGTYTYLYGLNRIAQQSETDTDYFMSVRQLADSNGYISLEQTFDPFGGLLNQSGTNASHYGFAGEWTDATGLQHLRARYYAPSQGRFMSRDPFPGMMGMPATLHPYVYALNNPVLYTDPSGEFAFIPLIIAAIAGGVLVGVGYYGLEQLFSDDVCAEWNWYEAAFWGGAGAVLGAAIVSVTYGGYWAVIKLLTWTTTIKAYGNLSQAANYGIQQGNQLGKAISGTGLRVHHLIEQRFAPRLGQSTAQARHWLSVAVTPKEHQIFTNAWRNAIGYSNQALEWTTQTATLERIWQEAQLIYKNYPTLLNAVRRTIFGE